MELDKAKQYIEDVMSGKQVCCTYVKQAVQRHLNDLKRDDIYFDEEAAERPLKFATFTKHYKGELAGQPFDMLPFQAFIVAMIFGWKLKKNGKRRFRKAYIEISRKGGKAIDLNTKIPTPNGFTTMGALKVGETIFGGDGKPCIVMFKSDINYNPESYLVTFSNGQQVKACADHQWQLSDYGEKKVVTTKQLFDGISFPYNIECADSTLTKVGKFETLYGFNYITIKSIVPCDPVPMQCIQVDSHDSTYLIGETFIRTHNTFLAAFIANYLFIADGEEGAEVYTGATTRKQSKLCFDDAKKMVESSPDLAKRVGVLTHNMNVISTNSKFEYCSSDYGTLDGLNPNGVILDEIHAYKTSGLYDIFTSAVGARTEPLILMITTAGFNKTWWCYRDMRKSVLKILEGGVVDDEMFGIVYTLDEKDDYTDRKVWIKANPSMGYAVGEDYLEGQVKASKIRPSETVNVLTKNFNIWTDAAKIWIPTCLLYTSDAADE